MVYNWGDKEAECYQLYVRERRSLREVAAYWKQRGFTPSKRAFQTQFKRWCFPSKQSPAYKNPMLIARVKELWEKNTTQKDMLDVLQVEGFQISDRELVRLRSRFGWFLRENKGRKGDHDESTLQKRKGSRSVRMMADDMIDQLAAAILAGASGEEDSDEEPGEREKRENEGSPARPEVTLPLPSDPLDSAEALRRQLRQQQLQTESDEKWRARKRRRRTRGWAGLPADAPGEPPRFPSETTLDESKAYLGLDNRLYAQIRDDFQAICRSESIFKKTVAGPEKWAELLQRLVRESPHLENVFHEQAETLQQIDALWKPKNYKTLSLDVICQDVTKRLRHLETRMTLSEAKNALNLNPTQTREVKHAFHKILKEDRFASKFEAGGERWNQLKQRWVDRSEPLKTVITPYDGGKAEHAQRLRAVEVLARDVMKRLRAEITRVEKEQAGEASRAAHRGPGPGPAPPSAPVQNKAIRNTVAGNTSLRLRRPANFDSQQNGHDLGHTAVPQIELDADLQIDPSLLLAASDAILPRPPALHHPTHDHHGDIPSAYAHTPTNNTFPALPAPTPTPSPLLIYFRLHPHSVTPLPHKTVWLSIVMTPTLEEVRRLAVREHPGSEVVALEGVVGTNGGDGEVCVRIDNDAELGAYLGHASAGAGASGGGQGKAVFVVRLGVRGQS
ncbi:uncharacterized protein CC84DRAFT_1168005 [Paraphaeosphaeria sporulosa]|uniref:Uncharacterized protein n=1 Tax=Paraphaeosphaeria sporulosa TaxID=1460663 RepID=A0A177C1T0_9PLEO|nr:uncharacterized protein CC84DRAFT_1168005 [Paraphaeosphaeria sporulosa]OAG00768.1 hypothetical protein CC84DRAFT_1168005 [Paraphaeosphaeria sporulosa]